MLILYFRRLALAYSTNHADMASINRKGCGDVDSSKFAKQGGITNGAKWYSLQGGNYFSLYCVIYQNLFNLQQMFFF